MVNAKNKWALSLPGRFVFLTASHSCRGGLKRLVPILGIPINRDWKQCLPNIPSNPVGAVSNRTGLECPINSKIHYNCNLISVQI